MNVPSFSVGGVGRIPSIGFGTFGSDYISNDLMMESVRFAIINGYRHIDCASVYGNEKEVGKVLKAAMDGTLTGTPIARSEFWITSKLWNDKHAKADVIPSCRQTLEDLQLEYLDCYLVHWPFPNFHPPKCSVTSRSPNARPFLHDDFIETWREMENLKKAGLSRFIGMSNMTIPKLEDVLPDCIVKPAVIEMELHPLFQQQTMCEYAKKKGMVIIGFCPLGSPHRPERDKTPDDLVDMEDPVVQEIARAHKVHPAAICLKWAHANGIIPIPLSTKERNIRSNLESVCSDPLTKKEIEQLKERDKGNRLVKGQVFLWERARDWHDIWDEEGMIAR
ncbi:MAG: aldo/keto reductase [Sphaerochaetaceae bacterium]